MNKLKTEVKEKVNSSPSKKVLLTKKPLSEKKQREEFFALIEDRKAKGIFPILTISNDFNVGLEIGKGAFAGVYRSVHKKTGFTVALKTYEKSKLVHKN